MSSVETVQADIYGKSPQFALGFAVNLKLLLGFLHSSVGKECNAGDLSSIPGLGRSPGEGNGNSLQCSCLENPMDRGAWRATVHGTARVGHELATKSKTVLKRKLMLKKRERERENQTLLGLLECCFSPCWEHHSLTTSPDEEPGATLDPEQSSRNSVPSSSWIHRSPDPALGPAMPY